MGTRNKKLQSTSVTEWFRISEHKAREQSWNQSTLETRMQQSIETRQDRVTDMCQPCRMFLLVGLQLRTEMCRQAQMNALILATH
jgi:hypothetical protein